MMISERIQTATQNLGHFLSGHRGRRTLRGLGLFWAGFFLPAAALGRTFQPIAMGFVCAAPPGWTAVLLALGASLGYPLFWGRPGLLGTVWVVCGLGVSLVLGGREIVLRLKALIPALCAFIVSGVGLVFLLGLGVDTPVPVHLLRVAVGAATGALVTQWRRDRSDVTDWAVQALAVLALAQVWPARYLGLGFVAAGYLAAGSSFPGLILAGLALDLSQVTGVKMTAVLCAGWCLTRLPRGSHLWGTFSAAIAYVPAAVLSGAWDVHPLPGLILGGALAAVLPRPVGTKQKQHTGEAALAQVRLEQMAQALHAMEQSLLSVRDPEPDRNAILTRAAGAACDTCPERRQCRTRATALTPGVLEQPGLGEQDLPAGCRKPHRLLAELRRGQEQLRRIHADNRRLQTFRTAAREQYGFLAGFLEHLSDDLAARHNAVLSRFRPSIGLSTRAGGEENGDCCIWFPGPGNGYYILLCDGMGTGPEAAQESMEAANLLKSMLSAGLSPESALRSLNSLAILRNLGGCVTVDLLWLRLDTGKASLYKWGAAPSYLARAGQFQKIGTAGPPPGLSQSGRESVDRLSLSGGETLILRSDGVSEEVLLNSDRTTLSLSPGELAAAILEQDISGGDDATAVVIRLDPCRLSTQ